MSGKIPIVGQAAGILHQLARWKWSDHREIFCRSKSCVTIEMYPSLHVALNAKTNGVQIGFQLFPPDNLSLP